MAEELKRHGLTFNLDLNKHPKDATNLSLINAENFKISEDGASLVSDRNLLENEAIKNTLDDYYNQYNYISEGISYKIINCIPTNDEIVLFVENTKVLQSENQLIVKSENNNGDNLNYSKIINIFRYNEKINVCKIIDIQSQELNLSDEIFIKQYLNYYDGKFSGTFTYNVKNELIIAFCEYDNIRTTEFECGEPLKIINLGYWDENNNLVNTSNLDSRTFSICPEVTIPEMVNDKIVSGYSKKGWYHFYIRYKINNYDYTQWFDFGKSIYLDEFEDTNIFQYKATKEEEQDLNINYEINSFMSDDLDFCKKTINFKLNNLDTKYNYYQLGFIVNTKITNVCKISNDINTKNNLILIDYSFYKDYDVNNILINFENFYNVKNIINYNNRLYISNYSTSEYENIQENVKYSIIEDKIDVLSSTNKIIIDFYTDGYGHNNKNIKVSINSNNEVSLKNIINDSNCKKIKYINASTKQTFTSGNIYEWIDNNINGKNGNYGQITYIIRTYTVTGTIPYDSEESKIIYNNEYESFIDHAINPNGYPTKSITIYYYKIEDISEAIYKYENDSLILQNYNSDKYHVAFYKNGKYIIDFSSTGATINYKWGIPKTYFSKYKVISKINTYGFNIEDISYTLIPMQPYNFYIHYVDKYGKYTNGYPLLNIENYTTIIKNERYVKLYAYDVNCIYINVSKSVFICDESLKDSNVTSNNVFDFINLDSIFIKGDISYINDNEEEITIYLNDTIKNIINKNYDENLIDAIKYKIYGYLWNYYPDYIKFSNNNYTFGEILHRSLNSKQDYRNIYISKNNDVCIIVGQDSYYQTNFNINFSNIKLNNNYKYFISYEKIDNILLQQGIVKKGTIKYKNDDNIELNLELENVLENKAYLYNDNLNYKNILKLNIEYGSYFIFNTPINNSHNLLLLNPSTNKFNNFSKITNLEYRVAGETITKNIGKSTNISFNGNSDEVSNESYRIEWLYKNFTNLYNNINKILIRCSQINNDSTTITTYSHWGIETAILINKDSYRINSRNIIYKYDNSEAYKNPNYMLHNIYFLTINNNFPESKQFNNKPKTYFTVQNDVDYENKTAKYYENFIFFPQDTIDLFKNNSLDYDESVLSIYTNYNKNNINQTNFIKTIRRSVYIKDESLENGWRTFESEAYQNIQENKGEITRIEGIGDLLLVHTKDSLFQFDKSNLLVTENKTVQLGQQDTFDVGYKEIFTSPFGYGGLQDKEAAIVGEFGYIWYNNDFNKIYQYDAGSLNVISGNIEFLLNRYKPTKCRFVDDKYNKRLLIQFQLNNNQVLNLTYNYNIKAFISFYINDESEPALMNEVYNTKTKFYILENNRIFSGFNKPNAKKLSFIINENYTKIKRLNYIKYKLYKRIDSSDKEFNANLPVEGNALSVINNRRPYSGYKLKVYNDLCTTDEIDIQVDLKSENNIDIKKPYYDLGNFTFNYLRDKDTNSQMFGNFFIVEFTFEDNQEDIIEFESLEYGISYEEN